jgi:protein ImuA
MLLPRHPSAGLAPSRVGGVMSAQHLLPAAANRESDLARAPDRDPVATALGPAAHRRLHAIHPAAPGQEAAATAFALALILSLDAKPERAKPDRPLLWVQAEAARAECGSPYGPGLAALGLDPARLVVLRAKTAMAVLAAAEMGLEEAGPSLLPADMLKLGKRLSLRAEQTRTPCCLIHATAAAVEMPVASRWLTASRPLSPTATPLDLTAPDFTTAFEVRLSKNRFGPLGRWSLAWRPSAPDTTVSASEPSHAARVAAVPRFAFTTLPACNEPPLSEPMAAAPVDRPARASRGAQPTPFRRTAA